MLVRTARQAVNPSVRSQSFINNAYALLATGALFWSGNHVLGRAIAGHVPPAGLNVFRWVLVALILAPIVRRTWRQDWLEISRRPGTMVFLALTGGALFGTLQFVALGYTAALNVAVMNSVAPAIIVLASFLIFGDRLSIWQLVGVMLSLLGVLAIVTRGSLAQLASLDFNGGDLLVVFNMTLWAIYSACLRLRANISGFSFLFALAVISAIANVPFAVWEHAAGMPLQLTWTTVLSIAYAGIFTSFLAYAAWSRGVELIGASRASAFLHLVPVYGVILAWAFLGERLQFFHVAGLVLILGGVTLVAKNPINQRAPRQ